MKKPPAKKAPPQPNNGGNHTTISVQSHKWEAPLPPPAILEDFDRVVPGAAERIVDAWETESKHRRALEVSEQRSFYRDGMAGKVFAFIFVIAALGAASFCAYLGAEWAAVILGGGTIGSVVWAFVQGRKETK